MKERPNVQVTEEELAADGASDKRAFIVIVPDLAHQPGDPFEDLEEDSLLDDEPFAAALL